MPKENQTSKGERGPDMGSPPGGTARGGVTTPQDSTPLGKPGQRENDTFETGQTLPGATDLQTRASDIQTADEDTQ